MKCSVLLSALALSFCAVGSDAEESAFSQEEYLAKDLSFDMVFVERVQTKSEVLYNDPAFADLDPKPMVPRLRPPVTPSVYQPAKQFGEFLCLDVYRSTLTERALSPGKGGWNLRKRILDWDNKPIQRGDIKSVRVVEGLPVMAQGNTYRRISHYHHEPKRILGTAPVYPDGSFRVQVPTEMPLHFMPWGQQVVLECS